MMTAFTKRTLDAAIDELKRSGYMVLVVMLDQKDQPCSCNGIIMPSAHCEAHGDRKPGVEVLCSETNDPKLLSAMLKTTLESLSGPVVADRLN